MILETNISDNLNPSIKQKVDKATGKTLGFFWKQIEGRQNHAFDTFGYNIANLECVADFACQKD